MKKQLLLILTCIISGALVAQVKPKQADWVAYDISHDRLLSTPSGIEQKWYSNGHSISLTDDKVFGNSHFGIGYGLGFMSNNYHTNLGIKTSFANGEEGFALLGMDSIESNKFTVQHLFIPVELRFRSSQNEKGNYFRFYVGGRFGVRIKSYSELQTEEATVRYQNLGSLNKINYGVYTRVGFGFISLYAYYGLSEMFKEGEVVTANGITGPVQESLNNMRPLSVGISLSL